MSDLQLERGALAVQVDENGAYIFGPTTQEDAGPLDLDALRWLQACAIPAAIAELQRLEAEAAVEQKGELPPGIVAARDEDQIEGQLAIDA